MTVEHANRPWEEVDRFHRNIFLYKNEKGGGRAVRRRPDLARSGEPLTERGLNNRPAATSPIGDATHPKNNKLKPDWFPNIILLISGPVYSESAAFSNRVRFPTAEDVPKAPCHRISRSPADYDVFFIRQRVKKLQPST